MLFVHVLKRCLVSWLNSDWLGIIWLEQISPSTVTFVRKARGTPRIWVKRPGLFWNLSQSQINATHLDIEWIAIFFAAQVDLGYSFENCDLLVEFVSFTVPYFLVLHCGLDFWHSSHDALLFCVSFAWNDLAGWMWLFVLYVVCHSRREFHRRDLDHHVFWFLLL